MYKLLTRIGLVAIALSALIAGPQLALAQSGGFQGAIENVENVGGSAEIATTAELPELIGQIINIVLGFLGIVLLLLVLYAGFLWMTAGGDEDKVEQAKKIIANSVIGLIIIVAAYAISNFVLTALVDITQ